MTEGQIEAYVLLVSLGFIVGGFGLKVIYDDHKREKEKNRRLNEFSKNL